MKYLSCSSVPRTVERTGARAGDILVGVGLHNEGLRLRISGDPATIKPIVDKLATAVAGPEADLVTVTSGDGVVAVGADPGYLHTLTQQGDLGDEDGMVLGRDGKRVLESDGYEIWCRHGKPVDLDDEDD